MSDRDVADVATNIHAVSGIRTRSPRNRTAVALDRTATGIGVSVVANVNIVCILVHLISIYSCWVCDSEYGNDGLRMSIREDVAVAYFKLLHKHLI